MMKTLACSYTVAASLAIAAVPVLAQDTELLRLQPPEVPGDPYYNLVYGTSVELSGDWLFVGDPVAGTGGGFGEVYFYRSTSTGWELSDAILAPDLSVSASQFARYLDADGNRLVVGSPAWDRGPHDENTGRVDVYELQPSGHWEHTAEVFPVGVPCPFGFGRRVAVSGDTLAVASIDRCAPPVASSRRVHLFDFEQGSWTLRQTLRFAPPPQFVDQVGGLGTALALQGDTLVVGAASHLGAALVYRRSGSLWNRVALLTDPATVDGDRLGLAVAIDGPTIVVGAAAESTNSTGSYHGGAAVVFEELSPNRWTKVQRLRPSNPFAGPDYGDSFGASVAIDGDEIVVGSYHARIGGQDTGAVYYYKKDPAAGWPRTESNIFLSRTPAPSDFLGTAVDIQDGIVVGGLLQLTTSASTGFALVFGVSRGTEYCTTLPNSTGVPTLLRVVGSDDADDETLVLDARHALPGAVGGFIASAQQAAQPLFGGFLCLAMPITRIGPMVQAEQAGDTLQRLDVDSISHLWSAGTTMYFQYWHEDSANQGVSLSNPIELTLR